MKWRDVVRLVGFLIVVALADYILWKAFGLTEESSEELLIYAFGFTILCAIRDEKSS